ncbi:MULTISPECIES: SDR family NAD(P)-dependent oxidoreductase [unclassified Nocardioides]|uniref:SDR family NAD(P)-dependent oxidoreductase n=1 Tax=unclassified Nocardioides TaxID=2615069 RepID=UPI0006FF71C7|nr:MULTISPECIES: SDR family NAD(P)-dependent oxidoreductase [unclassified Nocardioides]KQY57326.1 3-hydroxy-2-methylbutyryl-CoA dehydrogenase [Nocardioides sp. Root140]KQZ68841.1 3-hydroxy-2-methylbutyryl-CoA dehydrogenase [Nocardioides sp. Root151]KRF20481.1 3-hydroxy-2-methylbutyryl-CoA dehydrogenase [Nocardioides sp. Soil796]
MDINGINTLVTGAASGLGRATAERLIAGGATVTLVDLPSSDGKEVAAALGDRARFVAADVIDGDEIAAAFAVAEEQGPVRAVVHCAGRGRPMRLLDKAGEAVELEPFASVIELNVIGTFNLLRFAAQSMARNVPLDGDRGVCVLTASVAAFEGQIGQLNYSAAKAAVVGMTLPAARDLAGIGVRVCTIAPGTFDTPLLARARADVRESLAAAVPHPRRLGDPTEFASLAAHIVENGMLNGETIRLDGAIRMAPR